jgi:DNA (cytosine-5)-methyltransferase 1
MSSLTVAGLFAGIGGIELGLEAAGHHTKLLCEYDPAARRVLTARFPDVLIAGDVRTLAALPHVDLVTAGFPCQDLSQAGNKVGIVGEKSGLVAELFRLLKPVDTRPEWLLLENVSYMLRLDRGKAMDVLTAALEEMGYTWAYRVVDARAFGIPQRRLRVILLASLSNDPRRVLFADNAEEPVGIDQIGSVETSSAYGFYWTEGLRGLGWAYEAVPTLKAGSTIGIPSPPAVWMPSVDLLGKPSLADAERLQGFPEGWTAPGARPDERIGVRWRMVGNAVCVPVARWVGQRLASPGTCSLPEYELRMGAKWPNAAWGHSGLRFGVEATGRPVQSEYVPLSTFLEHPLTPLSHKATAGFLDRARRSTNLRFADGFLESVECHLSTMAKGEARAYT